MELRILGCRAGRLRVQGADSTPPGRPAHKRHDDGIVVSAELRTQRVRRVRRWQAVDPATYGRGCNPPRPVLETVPEHQSIDPSTLPFAFEQAERLEPPEGERDCTLRNSEIVREISNRSIRTPQSDDLQDYQEIQRAKTVQHSWTV